MPICRNCQKTINKFDSDFCPHCGIPDPIDSQYKTKDMTQFIDPQRPNYKLYKSKSRLLTALLCLFFGWSGAHLCYLGYKKKGLIEFLVSMAVTLVIGSVFLVLSLTGNEILNPILGFLVPFGFLFVFYAIRSIYYFKKDSLTDKNGVFLR